jgi:hypothetical protein
MVKLFDSLKFRHSNQSQYGAHSSRRTYYGYSLDQSDQFGAYMPWKHKNVVVLWMPIWAWRDGLPESHKGALDSRSVIWGLHTPVQLGPTGSNPSTDDLRKTPFLQTKYNSIFYYLKHKTNKNEHSMLDRVNFWVNLTPTGLVHPEYILLREPLSMRGDEWRRREVAVAASSSTTI